ncbi:BRCT domain-containing protein [Stenotrophomonas sp. 169]|uniref:BRCT domain-containing protein n=1 Tax=unclassified Stenotrophomonas TaxID=196198 RepID=UPI0016622CA3|nr:BRCT domain-containing protein [Stenotrophomonas sp. 169]QNR96622.1 BRCT domain-containing protein [Stenotrophomonas sp. 169]
MNNSLHDAGKAPAARITSSRRLDRTTDEMVGICRGLLADGHVSQQEAEFLKGWIERNSEFIGEYPFDRLYSLLADILSDGFIDLDESGDLHDTLIRFVGGEVSDPENGAASVSTSLPLCIPEPTIFYPEKTFLVTGTFSYGTRREVHSVIEAQGGRVASNVSRKMNYLIIGDLGSRDWINSNAGRKIQATIDLRSQGLPISIVAERHWSAGLS